MIFPGICRLIGGESDLFQNNLKVISPKVYHVTP